MELHPPAGDAGQRLHRDYLSPRPHRPVLIGSLETEPSQHQVTLARQLQDRWYAHTPVFPRLFEVQELTQAAGIWRLAENTEMQGKEVAPTPTQ